MNSLITLYCTVNFAFNFYTVVAASSSAASAPQQLWAIAPDRDAPQKSTQKDNYQQYGQSPTGQSPTAQQRSVSSVSPSQQLQQQFQTQQQQQQAATATATSSQQTAADSRQQTAVSSAGGQVSQSNFEFQQNANLFVSPNSAGSLQSYPGYLGSTGEAAEDLDMQIEYDEADSMKTRMYLL